MMKAGSSILFSLVVATAACGVGDEGGQDIDPNPNKLSCSDAFIVTGTFTAGTPARPVDVGGCWPVGDWSFTVTRDTTEEQILDITGDDVPDRCGTVSGTQPATTQSMYRYSIARMEVVRDDSVGYEETSTIGAPAIPQCAPGGSGDCYYKIDVAEGGSRECEGRIEIYSADRTQYWSFTAEQAWGDGTLSGKGQYVKYLEPQTLF